VIERAEDLERRLGLASALVEALLCATGKRRIGVIEARRRVGAACEIIDRSTTPAAMFGCSGQPAFANLAWRALFGDGRLDARLQPTIDAVLRTGQTIHVPTLSLELDDRRPRYISATVCAARGSLGATNGTIVVCDVITDDVVARTLGAGAGALIWSGESRSRTSALSMTLGAIDPIAVIRGAVETATSSAIDKQVQLEVELDGGLEVIADTRRLGQIVANLLSNAIKFTPVGGKVRIAARSAGEVMELTVRDSGPGIPAELRSQMFEPFSRGDTSITRAHDGLGIGLALVRNLVAGHHGTIEASLPDDGGTLVTVRIPLASR
jgi:hypothetical protein